MADIVGIIIGCAFVFGGFALLLAWWPMFVHFLMGTVPAIAIMIGAGVLFYYIDEIKSKSGMKKEEEEQFTSGRFRTGET